MLNNMLPYGEDSGKTVATLPVPPANSGHSSPIWVSTDLFFLTPRDPEALARDLQIDQRCYRRLDPEYFAWLKVRMHALRAAVIAGRVSGVAFEAIRLRFNEVQAKAIAMLGDAALLRAVRALDVERYRPPMVEQREPSTLRNARPEPHPCHERIVRARGLIDAIRDQALALGWTLERLYFHEGFDGRRLTTRSGLICFIGPTHQIGEVTRESIEIIGPPTREVRTRFYNPDVEQPWRRRSRAVT